MLLEEYQRDIQILGEDPPLNHFIGPLMITLTDTSNHEEELNGSETIPLEEIVDQEIPSSTGRIVSDYYNLAKVSENIKWDGYAYCPHIFNHDI
jgi:hypothetical protein